VKRNSVLAVVLMVGALSSAVAAQELQLRIIAVDRVKDNLYVLRGSGGHTVVFITTTGVVVVDTMNPGWGQTILETIKTLTDKPVTTLINTHGHADHVSGNVEFPATVDIIVQRNTKKNMEKMTPDSTATVRRPAGTIFEANGGRGRATRTFRDTMTLWKGADEVDLYYFGRGHTNGDTWVVFPALGVVDMGDLFPDKTIPLIDAKNGGSAFEIGETLRKGYNRIKNVDTIITGHGPLMMWADLKEYIALNEEFLDDMWRAERAKKTVDDVSGSWQISPKYTGYTLADPIVVKNNATLAYKEIVTVNGLSYLAQPSIDYGAGPQRTPPAEGVAPPTPAPTAPSPEPAAEP
jgi:glyoxylase-like metal-dependent hydrolase (beta-lactamase superfamily II)